MDLSELQERFGSLIDLLREADKSAGDEDDGRWVTMHGARVFIDKDGKATKGPAGATDSVNKTNAEKTKNNVDKVLGDNEFKVKEGEDGKSKLSHPEVKDEDGNEIEAEIDGPKLSDTIAGMLSWMDIVGAIAIKGTAALGRNIEKILGSVKDGIEAWQDSEK